jgi:hypothetical protein
MIRIYADANSRDQDGRYDLAIVRARRDLETHKDEIKDGTKVLLNVQDEFEVAATLVFDRHYQRWFGIPDDKTIRFYKTAVE